MVLGTTMDAAPTDDVSTQINTDMDMRSQISGDIQIISNNLPNLGCNFFL